MKYDTSNDGNDLWVSREIIVMLGSPFHGVSHCCDVWTSSNHLLERVIAMTGYVSANSNLIEGVVALTIPI